MGEWIIQRCRNALRDYEDWPGYCERPMTRQEMLVAMDECLDKWPEHEFRGYRVHFQSNGKIRYQSYVPQRRPTGGAPPTLGVRFPATIAVDLTAQYGISDSCAASTAWQALQELEANAFALGATGQRQYDRPVPIESVTRMMRKIRDGEAGARGSSGRIEYRAAWVSAVARLPKGTKRRQNAS